MRSTVCGVPLSTPTPESSRSWHHRCAQEVVVVRSSTVFPQSDSLKLDSVVLKTKSVVFKTRGSLKPDSVVLKTKSVSFRTRVPLKPDSVIPKTPVNICVYFGFKRH